MRYFTQGFFPAVFLLVAGAFGAVTTLTDETLVARIGNQCEILTDTTGRLNIYQVASSAKSADFLPSGEVVPNLGYTPSIVWVRFTVKNLTFSNPWILKAAFSRMDNVEIYTGDGEDWEVQELGQSLPFYARNIINRNLLFQLSLPFGQEKSFYLRYHNSVGMVLPLKLYASQQYQTHAQEEQLIFGIFFGFMLVLSLYNLILFFKVREWAYLYYCLYITGYGLFQFSLYGLAYQYLWPAQSWWANHNVPVFLAMAFLCRLLFTVSVLDSRRNAPRLHRALKALIVPFALVAVYLLLVVTDKLPPGLVLGAGSVLAVAMAGFAAFTFAIFIVNFRSLGKKIPAATTLMMAWIFMVSGLILYALKMLGFLPSNLLTEYGILFGSIGEMCLLFVSLGESIQAIKSKARDEYWRQQAAIHAFQEEQIRSMRLELELLKANIHPHFMLNSINAAIMWIREDPQAAEKLLHALSMEMRQLLRFVGEKVIPFHEEIRICRLHLEVMSLRHDKSFTLRLEAVETDEKIPPLVFHTLVENGLTHGYAGREAGVFVLSRSESAENIQYTLFNDGRAEDKGSGSSGLGLKYVRARLKEAYGEKWRLDSHAVEGGWSVTIEIQKEPERKVPADAIHRSVLAGAGPMA